jgi:hypothetical protein
LTVEDLIQVAVIVAILLVSLLGGGKKRKRAQAQRQAQTRARPTPPPQSQRTTRPRAQPAGKQQVEPQRQQGFEAILDLLRGELPSALEPKPPPQDLSPAVAESVDDEARPVETLKPLDEESHAAFHERYVERGPEARPVRVKRYRLTPKTAREAVVWTAIFSPPKGYE